MRKIARHMKVSSRMVTLPPNTWILEEAGVYLLARDAEMDQVPYVASAHLADPQQAEDFQMQIIEDAVNAGV